MNRENLPIPRAVSAILESIGEVARRAAIAGAGTVMQAHVHGLMQIAARSVLALGGLPQCQLAHPHADIQTGFDSRGNLRLECLHTPMHCWDLNGHMGPC
jgi:hypothetical protein